MKIDKRILGLVNIAHKSLNRPLLNGIKFEKDHAIATDGFRLLIIELDNSDLDQLPIVAEQEVFDPGEFVLNAKSVAGIVKQVEKNKNLPILDNAWTVPTPMPNAVRFVTTNLDSNSYKEIPKIEGDFPDYKKILPTSEPVLQIAFNPKLLAELLDSMQKAGAGNTVVFELRDRLGPVVIKAKDYKQREIKAIIMPMRVDDNK